MKKIITFLVLLLWIGHAQAITYTQYSSYTPYTEEEITKDELTDVKIQRRYKYYKIEKNYGDYSLNTTTEYPLLDEEDYIYQEFTDYTKEKPEEKEGRIIEEKQEYHYKKSGKVDTVTIKAKNNDIYLNTFKFYQNDKEIEYTIKQGNPPLIEKDKEIIIQLKNKIELVDLTFSFKGEGEKGSYYKYEISLSSNNKIYQIINAEMNGTSSNKITCKDFSPYQMDDYYVSEEMQTNKFLKLKEKYTLYRYKDKLYHIYNTQKVYYEKYLTEPYEDYIYKDEELFKDYYSKRTRQIIKENKQIKNLTTKAIKPLKIIPTNKSKNQITITNNTQTNQTDQAITNDVKTHPKITKINEEINQESKIKIWYVIIPLLLILSIIILLLSKRYKKEQ